MVTGLGSEETGVLTRWCETAGAIAQPGPRLDLACVSHTPLVLAVGHRVVFRRGLDAAGRPCGVIVRAERAS